MSEAVKLWVHQGAGDLPRPVGAEIEENDAVVVADGATAVADNRLHKLVGNALFIGVLHRRHKVGVCRRALAVHHGVVCLLHPVPAFVAVHGVVPAHDACDLSDSELTALFHGLCHKIRPGGRRNVPSV
ncbi:hypothetical protein SDC9_171331 [bioreactor metagenome]|uniref:Uncharacterized protein n=1 Tax=bioreactor metagenome TaxID=1076179 RepID=A0A645GAK3_9ZZZZ